MIILKSTTESLRLITSAVGSTVDYTVSYVDITTSTFAPSTSDGNIITNATTPILGSPAAATQRQVKLITATNIHASTTTTVTIHKYDSVSGGKTYDLTPHVVLLAGESMQYMDGQGWTYYAANGTVKGNLLAAAGVDKSVQFNNGGTALGADADFTYDNVSHRLSIGGLAKSGAIALGGDTTDEMAAPADQVVIYTKNVASKMVPKWIGPSGVDNPIQPGIGFNGIKQVAPASGTVAASCMTAFATAFINNGTPAQIAVTSTSLKTWMRSVTLATTTTAGTVASSISTVAEVCGAGGYFFVSRFYVGGTIVSGQRGFHGLTSRTPGSALLNLDYTNEFSVAKVGLAYSLTGTVGTWKVVASTTSAAMIFVDLGAANFTVNNTDVIELVLFCAPNAANIGYRVTNLTQTITLSGAISSNIPLPATALSVHHWVTNNGTGAIATFGLNKWYLESDY